MSPPTITFRGRYPRQPSTSNLASDGIDDPAFVPFSHPLPGPRVAGSGSVSVVNVDMCQSVNKSRHFTTAYDIPNLVVRRGQQFEIRVTFSGPVTPDDFQVEFMIGSSPTVNRGSQVVVTFGSRAPGTWAGEILENQGESVLLGITPSPNAIVGKFRTYVAIVTGGGMQHNSRDETTDLYVLFNAWCPDDPVFYPDEAGRMEYVLSDSGSIFQGSSGSVSQRTWIYGQFEQGILDACIYILDSSRMPIDDRGNAIKLVRKGSAMINSQDDNGVLVGNWSEDFSGGSAPTLWTGSVKILLQYANSGVPVCYAQCWVFAGVFNTFLRCLGIPSRVITNFNSAHDNTGNLKTDLIFTVDGMPDESNTRDSIWNYHCWNEVFMVRPDLPAGLGGWQVVDSTPQETSDGHFRCGPASVAAIKDGLLCHPFDAGFVFAEVNSDVVFLKRDRYGNMSPFKVDKTHVGQAIYTQGINGGSENITHSYKYQEGSSQDEATMARAEQFGCERDHSELAEGLINVTISNTQVHLGQDVNLVVDFHNQGDEVTIHANLSGAVIFYTGITAKNIKDENFSVTVPAHQTERAILRVAAQEYLPHLGSQHCLHFVVTGHTEEQSISAISVVSLLVPSLLLTVNGQTQVHKEMWVTVTFTNPFSFPLHNVSMALEGSGVLSYKNRFYSFIDSLASISWKESFVPRLGGLRRLVAVLDCSSLREVFGSVDFYITG
ncbi:coagulation factor XIII A chain-like [Aulostomus maculatus]